MVNQSIISQAQNHPQYEEHRADFARWCRQCFYMPWFTTRKFDAAARQAIEEAVAIAEAGHAGEIRVVIEAHLPLNSALHQSTIGRARDLFASLGVWDTAHNSGVLLYVNLCEHRVEIVADRGINAQIEPLRWQSICQQVTVILSDKLSGHVKGNAHQQGVILGVELIGATLSEFYTILNDDQGNELSNAAIFL
jgi:uncharacterized membrane protein